MTHNLETLAEQWLEAKKKEDDAKNYRLQIEKEFLKLANLKPEGTNHVAGLKIVTGYTQTWDQVKLGGFLSDCPLPMMPFKTELKPDSARMKVFQEEYSGIYKAMAEAAMTLKEKKPTFSKGKDND